MTYTEIHPQRAGQKSSCSLLAITIAAWELSNKILFLWKTTSCGNQDSSQKWISFDAVVLESKGGATRRKPLVEVFPEKVNSELWLVTTLAQGLPSVKFLFNLERLFIT